MTSIHCPHCQKTLKTDKTIPPNAKIKCPACKQQFTYTPAKKAEPEAVAVAVTTPTREPSSKLAVATDAKRIVTPSAAKPSSLHQSPPPAKATGTATAKPPIRSLPQALPALPDSLPPMASPAAAVKPAAPAPAALSPTTKLSPRLLYTVAGVLCSVALGVGIWFLVQGGNATTENASADDAADATTNVPAQNADTANTAPPLSKQPPVAKVEESLKAGWQIGNQYIYKFAFEIDSTTPPQTVSGRVTYSVNKSKSQLLTTQLKDRVVGGSGTAFVVNSEGVLVTCEHVIRDAKKIFVNIGPQKLEATVLAKDPKHGLALLKVAATGLPALPLSSTRGADTQQVVAVGYPLGNWKNKVIKGTAGTLTNSTDNLHGRPLFRSLVNAGCSGGPMLDSAGRVIGVCNAPTGLGTSPSNVTTIPSARVLELMSSQNLRANSPSTGISGADDVLLENLKPAVAAVEVAELNREPQLLALDGNRQTDRDEINAFRAMPSTADLVIDDRGEIHPEFERGPKPVFFNGLDTLGIEYLAAPGEKSWELKRKFLGLQVWALRMSNNPSIASGPPFPPGPPGQFPPGQFPPGPPGPPPPNQQTPGLPPGVMLVDVIDHVSYRVVEQNEQTITLEKEHSMVKWQPSSSGEPQPFLQGTGTVTLDAVTQIPVATKMTYRADDHPQLGTATFTYTYQLESSKSSAVVKSESAKRHAEREAQNIKLEQEQQQRLEDCLSELRAGSATASAALERLKRLNVVPERRDEVAKLLNKYLRSKNPAEVSEAVICVRYWGTEVNKDALLEVLETAKPATRGYAILRLGEMFKTAEMAQLLAAKYQDPVDAESIRKAWRTIGRPAEDVALQALQTAMHDKSLSGQKKGEIVNELLNVLMDAGGKKSYDFLANPQTYADLRVSKSTKDRLLKQFQTRLTPAEKAAAQNSEVSKGPGEKAK